MRHQWRMKEMCAPYHNDGLERHKNTSPEGIANKQRACQTLRVGDVVRYAYSKSLVVITKINNEQNDCYFSCHHLFPCREYDTWNDVYVFHGDWELCGHIDLDAETLAAWSSPAHRYG